MPSDIPPSASAPRVRIEPWTAADRGLLERLMGDPAMMEHLGGPDDAEAIAARQARYVRPGSGALRIVDVASGEGVGFVGFWDRAWRGEDVYETGWSVVPEHQGRGLASLATAQVLELARADGRRRFVHAFPGVENLASNAICRKLGFVLAGACDVTAPSGVTLRCNDWRLDLAPQPAAADPPRTG